MNYFLRACAVACAAMLAAPAAQATTFTVDAANSSVSLTETASGALCDLTNCGVEASLASGLSGTSFDLNNVGDAETFDFLNFTGAGTGGVAYDIEATLAFSPPSLSVTSGGSGGAILFQGSIIAGLLQWTAMPTSVFLSDGSEVHVEFEGGLGFFLGPQRTTTATLSLQSVPAPVPLPASGLLLLAGVGGLAALRRARR